MATNKKAKGKATAKRKTKPVSRATRKRTVSKAKKIRKKIAKKAPLRRKKGRPTAKTTGEPTPVSERAPEGVSPPSSEQRIGVVTHYYSHLSVVAMQLEPGTTLRVGDVIHIRGHTTDFTQKVESLEVNHASVTEVGPNDDFGLKVVEHAREHDTVFRVRS
jgi:hypothetical protein